MAPRLPAAPPEPPQPPPEEEEEEGEHTHGRWPPARWPLPPPSTHDVRGPDPRLHRQLEVRLASPAAELEALARSSGRVV
jgi:hypothetical protein